MIPKSPATNTRNKTGESTKQSNSGPSRLAVPSLPVVGATDKEDNVVSSYELPRILKRIDGMKSKEAWGQLIVYVQESLLDKPDQVPSEAEEDQVAQNVVAPKRYTHDIARAILESMPKDAQDLYRTRYEGGAAAAYKDALEKGDADALEGLSTRYPLTRVSSEARESALKIARDRGLSPEGIFLYLREERTDFPGNLSFPALLRGADYLAGRV